MKSHPALLLLLMFLALGRYCNASEAEMDMPMDMSEHARHLGMTELRKGSTEDQARADKVLSALRESLKKYADYQAALKDGYKIFLPNVPLPEYHFTNYYNAFRNAFHFDPSRPTSLLYRKTSGGYELIGAMYTAPRTTTEDELNKRIPLSLARWHRHINICLPPRGENLRDVDW